MSIIFRNYSSQPGFSDDFHKVREFLVSVNKDKPIPDEFEWGRWEWSFSLPYLDTKNLHKIGIWEDNEKIVAMVTYEQGPGDAYFCLNQNYEYLKEEMLVYAMKNLKNEERKIRVLINNADRNFQIIASNHGFKPTQNKEATAVYDINLEQIKYNLPDTYSIISLADEIDLKKFDRLLWRGFNHEGEPPDTKQQLKQRKISISGPHLISELNIIVVAPKGDYSSYCGIWYDTRTEYALIEPVATAPEYRKLGLGRAAVLEAIKRAGKLGAKKAFVGSSLQFYYQIGFHPLPASTFWAIR